MAKYMDLKINNSKGHAVNRGKWKDPGAKLYDQLLEAFHCVGGVPIDGKQMEEMMKNGKYIQWPAFLQEAYLVAPINDIKNSPYGVTPYSRSGCKYPHHIIRNGELVVSIPGLKAAYDRAFRYDDLHGSIVRHLNRHMKELGLTNQWHHGQLYWNEEAVSWDKIEKNFDSIYSGIFEQTGIDLTDDQVLSEASHGNLKYDFRDSFDYDTGHAIKIVYKLNGANITDVGGHYLNDSEYAKNSQGITDKNELIDYIHKNISKKGSLDHQSFGQMIVAIVDRTTGINIKNREVRCVGPYSPGFKEYNNDTNFSSLIIEKSILDSIHRMYDKQGKEFINQQIFKIKVGTIDNNKTFKSTKWFTKQYRVIKDANGNYVAANNMNDMRTASEHLQFGRGVKIDDIDPDYPTLFEPESEYLHPSKKDKKRFARQEEEKWDNKRKESINRINKLRESFDQSSEGLNSEDYIRPLNKNDVTKEYFLKWFFKMDEFENDSPENFDFNVLVDCPENRHYCYGYFIDNKLEGIIRIRYSPDNHAYGISMLFVDTDKQHIGIGNSLMKHCVSLFGSNDMILRVFEFNTNAISLYEKYGFVKFREDIYDDGPDSDPKFVGKKMYLMKREGVANINDTATSINGYDPPLPFDKLPNHLKNDPIHVWRAKTGIELIHKEPSLEELDRIWNNWNLMSDEQKQISDKKSMELFGVSNEDNYYTLQKSYDSNILDDKIEESYELDNIPDTMYFSSPNQLQEIKGKVFMSPYIGISSIFLINRPQIVRDCMQSYYKQDIGNVRYNLEYKEWGLSDDDLRSPLDVVHITHNISGVTESFSGSSSGYIYELNISGLKKQIGLFMDKSANREVVYQSDEPIPIVKVIPHTTNWKLSYDDENVSRHGNGYIELLNTISTGGEAMLKESDDLDWITSFLMEDAETPPPVTPVAQPANTTQPVQPEAPAPEPTSPTEPVPQVKEESLPKKTDKAESSKNGIRRKNLYIAFITWCKEYNNKNTFGSIFDKDAFNVSYPFIPEDLRYFYRLANPMLCVLAGELTFFAVAELRKLNAKNSHIAEMLIFAATPNDVRVFNVKDKKVYRGTEENGTLKLNEILGDTFDTYIQKMINKGDILNAPLAESTEFVND